MSQHPPVDRHRHLVLPADVFEEHHIVIRKVASYPETEWTVEGSGESKHEALRDAAREGSR